MNVRRCSKVVFWFLLFIQLSGNICISRALNAKDFRFRHHWLNLGSLCAGL